MRIKTETTTAYTGLAYSLPNTDQVFIHTKWATKKFTVKEKPKTVILLDSKNDYKCIAFGEDAIYKLWLIPCSNFITHVTVFMLKYTQIHDNAREERWMVIIRSVQNGTVWLWYASVCTMLAVIVWWIYLDPSHSNEEKHQQPEQKSGTEPGIFLCLY